MTARFDPVRDSAASPPKRYAPLEEGGRTSEEHYGISEKEDEAHIRRPSRKASIADLLNDEPPRSSRAAVSGDYAGAQHYDTIDRRVHKPSSHHDSSPSSSIVGLLNAEQGPDVGSSYRYEASPLMHRHSSSHSDTSSLDHSLHPHQGSQSSHHHSPSVLHLLNSDMLRNASTSPLSEPHPRSRGPSFAGRVPILSPSNEEMPYNRRSSSSQHEYRREEGVHYLSPSQHQSMDLHRRTTLSTGQSYFAVPDLPNRSPDTLRSKAMLPLMSASTEPSYHHIPSHHLRGEADYHDNRPQLLQQPLTPGSHHNSVHVHTSTRYHSPYGTSSVSSREMTPSRSMKPPPLSPLEVPPTPGEYNTGDRHHPSYFTSHDSVALNEQDRDAHMLRPWSEKEATLPEDTRGTSPSRLTSDQQGKPQIATGGMSLPPAKRRKKSVIYEAADVASQNSNLAVETTVKEEAHVATLSQQPKRGRPKGRKSISNGIGSKEKAEVKEASALASTPLVEKEIKLGDKGKEVITNTSDVDMKDLDTTSTLSTAGNAITASPSIAKPAYRPTKRVSIPTTIRMPVTAKQVDEMRYRCQNSLRSKWQTKYPNRDDGFDIIVARYASQISLPPSSKVINGDSNADTKRKREAIEREESNAALVAQHYNSRQDQGLGARKQSPILPLRNFNNWVKSVIISSNALRHGRVLDLGGGKGGDLNKWDKAQIREYILCDIAEISIQQAESRYRERRYNFQAQFFSFDCFAFPLADNIPKDLLDPLFDTVSLQFCLHYGWESVQKAQLMLENVARYLKPGGIFVGTIPNADLLRYRLTDAMQATPSKTSFGNQYYEVIFGSDDEKNKKCPPFGHKYNFTLLDAVDDVAEYVVDWNQLVSLANQNGLECIFKKTFDEIWHEEGQDNAKHEELARRMKIYPNGPDGLPMNEELWEATSKSDPSPCSLPSDTNVRYRSFLSAGIYIAFAFEKKNRI